MLTPADKLNILIWSFILFSAFVLSAVAFKHLKKKRISGLYKAAVAVIISGTLLLVDMHFIEPYWISIEEVTIHDGALAWTLEGIRVVQISDVHLQGGIGYRERKLIEKVNALKPDLLFITGDFFSDRQKSELPEEVKGLSELIRSFRAGTGIFGIEGNYDQPLHKQVIRQELRAAGLYILSNENRGVSLPNGRRLYLAGFDDSQNARANMKALNGIPQNAPIVLLVHDPDNFGAASQAGVNLVLAGHTHGGQIGIPFLIRMSHSANKSPYMRGLFDAGKTKLYVNRGIGTTSIPVRLFCRPEITVFKFQK